MVLIKRLFYFILKHKIILGINYHRVGNKILNDPFSGLHTVKFNLFKLQIRLINIFFKIVSLNDIEEGNIKSKINFFISFDDVPSVSKHAFEWLSKKKIPFVICPNLKFIEEGSNISDKFRFLSNEVKKSTIEEKLKKFLNEEEYDILRKKGLKALYKSYKINQPEFEKIFLKYVFNDVSRKFSKIVLKKKYLDWKDINLLSKKTTVASHGKNHYNFFYLSYEEIFNELKLSKNVFEDKINSSIKVFAVPFGAYSQHLGIKLSEAAKDIGYKQVLWAGSQGIIFNKPNEYHIQHLFRFNAPDNFFLFLKSIIASIKNTKLSPLEDDELVSNYDSKNFKFEVLKNPPVSKIMAYENIIRPFREYSSNNKFIENIYMNNPYRSSLPYAYALSREGVLNSVSYHLYKNYCINGNAYKIVEHSGWRKINSLKTVDNVKLYLLVSRICKAFYSWRPSESLRPGYKKSSNYFTILNTEYLFKVSPYEIDGDFNFEVYSECPKNIDNFLDKFNKKFYLTMERSSTFYKWRIDNYPLGKKKYFIIKDQNYISCLLVAQIYNNKAMIVDLVSLDYNYSIYLIKKFINYCYEKKINQIKFSTSNKSLIKKINKNLKFNHKHFESFIYIKNLVNEKLINKELLKNSESCETYVSGDVLIR